MSEWQLHFPFDEVRPAQEGALDFIEKSIEEGATDIFLELPTGVGKSPIAIAIGELAGSAYISTTSIALEDQYIGDFAERGLKQLHSKANYAPCLHEPEVDNPNDQRYENCGIGSGVCECWNRSIDTEKERRKGDSRLVDMGCLPCPYREDRWQFYHSRLANANFKFLGFSARFWPGFPAREIAIFDEAHTLFEGISDIYSIEFNEKKDFKLPRRCQEVYLWLREIALPASIEMLKGLESEYKGNRSKALYKRLEAVKRRVINIEYVITSPEEYWVFDLDWYKLTVKPVWPKFMAPRLLEKIAPVRIYLTATLIGWKGQARWLGIDWRSSTTRHLSLPSPFPVENRQIYIKPCVRWDWHEGYDSAYPQLKKGISRLLKHYNTERGLIHVSSYEQAQRLIEVVKNPRLMTHERGHQAKKEALAEFYETPGAVLVSFSSHEGLDLYDERCRFNVIAKMPFISLGDEAVQKRKHQDKRYYDILTSQKLIQACGRAVRHGTDWAHTYILDDKFMSFYRRNSQLIPSYIRRAIIR